MKLLNTYNSNEQEALKRQISEAENIVDNLLRRNRHNKEERQREIFNFEQRLQAEAQ